MLEFTMRRAQWNAARRNDIDLIGIDAATTRDLRAGRPGGSPTDNDQLRKVDC